VPIDSDPLTTQLVPFSRDDWVVAFHGTSAKILGNRVSQHYEIQQVFLLKNESDAKLGKIALGQYILDGTILEFQGYARRLSGRIGESLLVNFRSAAPVASTDSEPLLDELRKFSGTISNSGEELGFFRYEKGR